MKERMVPRPNPQPRTSVLSLAECEQFLLHEARLLDEGRFDEWLALFTADAWYWVPLQPNQANPHDTFSLMYDDRRLLETRVRRLASPRIYSQEPRSRTSRMIGNVTIEEVAQDGKAVTVRSKFQLLEYRRESQRIFGGTFLHQLIEGNKGTQIAWKRVDLLNSDAPHEGLVVPF
jgi:3-phenylpropionate/cinnamic acid dioxygenase small subunit